ncbi:MAG: hypothetical protein WCE62_13970 [Polyangiales bacterium]
MSRARPDAGRIWLPLAAVLALLSVGCGSEGINDDFTNNPGTGGAGGDAGFEAAGGQGGTGAPVSNADGGGVRDNPIDQLFANPQRDPRALLGGLGPDAAGAEAYADAASACYMSPEACDALDCRAFASCCVSNGTCCEPIVDDPPVPALLDFRTCAGQTVEACAQNQASFAVSFGPQQPVLNARGLVPNGTATAEGGVTIGERMNLSSQRVELEVRFALPIGCGSTCLQSAGVAFTGAAPAVFVDAELGLLLSGSREVVNLMIGNAVADSFDAGTDSTRWGLILSPQGSVEVLRDGVSQGTYAFDSLALEQAQLVAFGRNLGDTSNSAAIAVLEVAASSCDNPRAWSERQPVSISLNGTEVPSHAFGRAPSIVDAGVSRLVAYEVDGAIFVAEEDAPGALLLANANPALVPTEPHETMGLGDPELVWDGTGLFLFYTARSENGAGSIRAASAVGSVPAFIKSETPILVPSGDVLSFDAPSVIFRDGLWLLIARATLASGATELRAFYTSALEAGWARVVNGGLESLTRSASANSELRDPSLIVHNSAYQLYFSRRAGTRWSVELAVSDELLLWRSVGEVLGGSDEGFDALGARGADAISAQGRVDVVYSGQDGVSLRLGTASRVAPSDSAPSNF